MADGPRWPAAVLLVLALLTLGSAAARYLDSPLRFDESEWPPQAEGILRHGAPLVHYTEEPILRTKPYYGFDAHYGMWHPPAYLYSLAASIRLFGRADRAVRIVSAAWMGAALWLVWVTLASGGGRDRPWLLRTLPLSVACLSPLVIHGTFYADIDNSCLNTALFLMACAHLRLDGARGWMRGAALAAATLFALWCKLTTPVAMAIAIVLHRTWQRGARAALADAAAMLAALPIFAITYWAYCAAFDYPARFMFEVSYLGKRDVVTSVHSLRDILHSLRWHIVWISPGVVLAIVAALAARLRRLPRAPRAEPADLLFLFGAIALAQYVVVGLMGKYAVPAALALAAAAGHEMAGALGERRTARPWVVVAVGLALTLLHVWIGPLQVRPPASAGGPMTIAEALADPRNGYLLLSVVAGLLAIAAIARLAPAPSGARGSGADRGAAWAATTGCAPGLALGILAYIAAANPAGEIRLAGAGGDRSPLRPFTDTGFRAVVAYLEQAVPPGAVAVLPKDIGYYFGGRHYRAEDLAPALPEVDGPARIRFVVDSRLYPLLTDRRVLERAGFARVAVVGDYEVFER